MQTKEELFEKLKNSLINKEQDFDNFVKNRLKRYYSSGSDDVNVDQEI